MANPKSKQFDIRTSDRYVKKGIVSQKEYDAYVKALPDEEGNATWVQMDLHETEISVDDDSSDDDEAV
ncbi:hypothetical protein K2X33_11565 [bacterium]|nr:hypothetical protein [bacterium]